MASSTPIPISLSDATDASLIETCLKSGRPERSFKELTVRYGRLVQHYVYRMTQNVEFTEDITQEVFLKAFQNLHRFDPNRPFKPWLMRIAANTTISALRKPQNSGQQHTVSLDALSEQGWQLSESQKSEAGDMAISEPSTSALNPEAALDAYANKEIVEAALQKMDDKYRQILILRYFQDLSYEEIAQTLGMPLNTVRTWIRRGLDQFKKAVQANQTTSGATKS